MNEHERAAHLGRAWDTFRRIDLDRCDPADVATVRSLIALDRLPMPDLRFVARLETALTGPVAAPQPLPLHWPPAQAASPCVDQDDMWTRTLPLWDRLPLMARWAAAGIAILLSGAVMLTALQSGLNDDGNPTSLPAYGDASTVALTWQETPECDVPARSGDSFRTLFESSANSTLPEPPVLDHFGVPADAITTAMVESTMREIFACRTAREPGSEYALYSDGALLRARQLAQQTYDSQERAWLSRSAVLIANAVGTPEPEPAPNNGTWSLRSIQDVQVLPDGRVRAIVFYGIGDTLGTIVEGNSFVAFFVKHDGIYVIDDAEGFTYLALATPAVESGPFYGAASGGMNTGQASGAMGDAVVVDYPTGDPPLPLPTENVDSGNTSGGATMGGAATGGSGGYSPAQPTPGSADD